MPIVSLNTNVAALNAQRGLSQATRDIGSNYTRLASGLRINRAGDDAAGLAISETVNADRRVYLQGIRNVNDGVSLISILDGALVELGNIVTRIQELAEQSANGVLTTTQRSKLDSEAQSLRQEYDRIVTTVSFNGISPYDTPADVKLQLGYGTNEQLTIAAGSRLVRTEGDGTINPELGSFTFVDNHGRILDFNGDGKSDWVSFDINALYVSIGNGDGTFKAPTTTVLGGADGPSGFAYGDIDNDGDIDVIDGSQSGTLRVHRNNGAGQLTLLPTIPGQNIGQYETNVFSDVNNDGILDIVNGSDGSLGGISILFGNGNGTFKSAVSYDLFDTAGHLNTDEVLKLADLNGDAIEDIAIVQAGGVLSVLFGNSNGSFTAGTTYTSLAGGGVAELMLSDFDSDGDVDILTKTANARFTLQLNNGSGTFSTSYTFSVGTSTTSWDFELLDIDEDGKLDIATGDASGNLYIAIANGNGTFKAGVSYADPAGNALRLSAGDVNGDGVTDLFGSQNVTATIYYGEANNVTTMEEFSLATQQDALDSMEILRSAALRIQAERGYLGAVESRLGAARAVLQERELQLAAASSRIRDVDVAEEAASLVRNQIRQSVSASILAQANQLPALAKKLLEST